jgi:hypothetical protein
MSVSIQVYQKNYWRFVIFAILFIGIFYFFSVYDSQGNYESLTNYRTLSNNVNYVGVIKQSNRNIFFIETSYNSDNESFVMNARSACSIESTARTNPDNDIYVLFTASKPLVKGTLFYII